MKKCLIGLLATCVMILGFGISAKAKQGDIVVDAGESLTISESVDVENLVVNEGGSLVIDGRLSAANVTLYGDAVLKTDGRTRIEKLKVDQSNGMDVHIIDLGGRISFGQIELENAQSGDLLLTYDIESGAEIRDEISGGSLQLDPYRGDSALSAFDGNMVLIKANKNQDAAYIRLYKNTDYSIKRASESGENAGDVNNPSIDLIGDGITLYMITIDSNGVKSEPQTYASIGDAVYHVSGLNESVDANIYMVRNDYVPQLTILGGHKISIYKDAEDCTIYVSDKVVVKSKGTILQVSGIQIRSTLDKPADYQVKRNAGLQLTGTRVGNISMNSYSNLTLNKDVCIFGNITGNGNLSALGEETYVFMGNVNIHDLSVASPSDKSLPEFRFLMNKKLVISGNVNVDSERIRNDDGVLLSYAYMADSDQIYDNAGGATSATIDQPLFVALDENVTLVQAVSSTVVSGMFRVKNTNASGGKIYLAKTDRYIKSTHCKTVLYQIGATTAERLDEGRKYGGLREAMDAINYAADYNIYEVSVLEDMKNVDLSVGIPQRLRLLTGGAVNSDGTRRVVNIKTKKDILLLGHINIAFINLDASLKTLYANDKDITLLMASVSVANLSHCNVLTIGEGSSMTIHKEGNTINSMQLTADSARLDCPQYAAFRADDIEKSILAKEAEPSKQATDDAYRRAVNYLVDGGFEVPWTKALFIGDSITAGVQSGVESINKDHTYPERFVDRLGIEVTNAGIGGSTVWTGGPDAMVSRCLDYGDGYDAIFIMGGINDWFYGYECAIGDTSTPGTFSYDYNHMLDLLCEKYPDADIFVLIPLEPKEHAGITPYEDLNVIRNVERSLGRAHDCYIIDLAAQGVLCCADKETRDAYYSDGAHPNSVGYEFLGTILAAQAVELVNME